MGKIDYFEDALKISKKAQAMAERIVELEGEVAELKGFMDLAGKTMTPSTRKVLRSAAKVSSGPVAVGSAVSVVSRKRPGTKPGAVRVRYGTGNKYFGVHSIKKTGKFNARVDRKGFRKNLGTFAVEEEAAIAVQEFLGNTGEVARLRALVSEKGKEGSPAKAQRREVKKITNDQKLKTKDSKIDARHKADAAEGIEAIKGSYRSQWECKGCGWTYGGASPERCPKCNGISFEKIKVLSEPEKELGRGEGRHNPERGKLKIN